MDEALIVPRRCNGPPDSGNGGYTCGLVAGLVGGPAEVTLRAPPPLERPLRVERDGEAVRVFDGETLVAEGRPGDPGLEPPEPPSLAMAVDASAAGSELWASGHPFPTCVTCGPDRRPGDGLRIFPGEVPDAAMFAAPWTPDGSLVEAEADPGVPAPWSWAALDCPSSAPVASGGWRAPCVLGRLTARLDGEVEPREPHLVISWLIERDGRKHHSGSALFTAGGELRGLARALWIELRSASPRRRAV